MHSNRPIRAGVWVWNIPRLDKLSQVFKNTVIVYWNTLLVCKVIGRYGNTSYILFISTDIDECVTGSANCMADSSCSNTAGSFTCDCDSGYDENEDGDACVGRFNLFMLFPVWITTHGPILWCVFCFFWL